MSCQCHFVEKKLMCRWALLGYKVLGSCQGSIEEKYRNNFVGGGGGGRGGRWPKQVSLILFDGCL